MTSITHTHSIVVALTLAIGLVPATRARAAEPASAATSVATTKPAGLSVALALEIEVSSESLEAELASAFERELERSRVDQQLDRASDSGDLQIRVRIWEPEPDTAVIDASVEFEGETLEILTGLVCIGCTVDDIAGKSLSLLAGAVAKARTARATAEPPTPTVTTDSEPAPAARRRAALGPAGYVGVAASGLGLGSAIAGVVFLYRGRVVDSESGAAVETFTDYRPLGLGLVGAGLGAMVIGDVLLGVDLGVLRDRRAARGRAHVELEGLQVAVDHGVVLGVRGRF